MKKYQVVLGYVTLIILSIGTRSADLDAFTSPDEAQWERNTQNFVTAIKKGDFKNLYQQPHPGITTQYLAAATIHAQTWGIKRLPLTLFLGIAVLYITYLIRTNWGDTVALLAGFLLAVHPMLIGHSRVLAMDALLAVFALSAVLHHIIWIEKRHQKDILLAGIFTSLAILSKLSAVGLIVYFIIASTIALASKKITWKDIQRGILVYTAASIATTIILFPTILTDTKYVWEGSRQFFTTEHFQQQVHALGPWWYPQALLIWTTPVQILGLLLVPFALIKKNKYRDHSIFLLLFCILFFLEIQFAVKKGDRYMLPVFVVFDIIASLSIATIYANMKQQRNQVVAGAILVLVCLGIIWQLVTVTWLHPYVLAYRNPLFTSIAAHRTMGWGEGLDLAAVYLNQKPNAENLLVAAYYEGSFAYHFKGKFTSAERLAKETAETIGADYVVLYRTMEGRAPERWETKVLQEYRSKQPEHTITLNNEEYVWIYKTK